MKRPKHRTVLFCGLIILNFIMILIYNHLTPYMSDDLWYDIGVTKPLSTLLKESANAYMTWGGRSVADFLLRLSFCMPKPLFNICNSLMFVILTILIYLNIEGRRKHDAFVYGYIMLFMWLFGVEFSQTVLWVSGACNYLWTGVIIMSFVTLLRIKLTGSGVRTDGDDDPAGATTAVASTGRSMGRDAALSAGTFLLGLLAGWCNENTSGGALLLVIAFVLIARHEAVSGEDKSSSARYKIPVWAVMGCIGCIIGILIMITAPGVRVRAAERLSDEEHSGMLAYLARLLKLNDAFVRNLAVLLLIVIVLSVYLILKGSSLYDLKYICIFALTSVITVYVLIATTVPMDRALFGAGIFMIIAAVQAIVRIPREDVYMSTLKYSVPVIMALYLIVTYLSCGADLMRIERELDERAAYAESERAIGNMRPTLPMIRTEWDNRYTYLFEGNDISDEEDSYGNAIYRDYYGLKGIKAVPRDEWTEY